MVLSPGQMSSCIPEAPGPRQGWQHGHAGEVSPNWGCSPGPVWDVAAHRWSEQGNFLFFILN